MVSIKINWNAAMDIHTMKMDIGVVIRDSRDEELATLSESKDYIIVLEYYQQIPNHFPYI
jgi:hypothetical protein